MSEFLELNPWIESVAAVIAVLVFVLGVLALATLFFGTWLLRTALGAKKVLGMVASIAVVPGKSGKAKFALGLMLANFFSGIGGRFRKKVAHAKKPQPL